MMMNDLGPDPKATQGATPAQQIASEKERSCATWTDTVDARLAALEDAVARQADVLQVLLLRCEDGK